MPPKSSVPAASKQTIEESFRGTSTRRAYATYQKQFESYLQVEKPGITPESAGTEDCTDFFHYLYTNGRKARTIDLAKSALVAFFKDKNVSPNPAQNSDARRYIIGLQKFNKQNNVDEEKKAYPLTAQELSTLMNGLSGYHPFVGSLVRLLLAAGFLGCFRISEVLNLRVNDVQLGSDSSGRYLSIRLRWHKKANVEEDCQIYHLVDEKSYPCLRVCAFYDEYLASLRASGVNLVSSAFVFPNFVLLDGGVPRVDWQRPLEQATLRKLLAEVAEVTPNLPIGITLHSLRRGGAFYRVFESTERRFNFRELMAWCRWADAKTCCEYLVTQSISNEINPRNLLRTGGSQNWHGGIALASGLPFSIDDLGAAVARSLQQRQSSEVAEKAPTRQLTKDAFIAQKTIPTARSGLQAWQQWFVADPGAGLVCALKDYTSEMIRNDRKRYSERLTLAGAFSRYSSFEQFDAAYAGFTKSYARLLKEVRRRKRLNAL
ncbi:hypothetical protein H310_02657 [Aphanomyces invadans]|uniref:Core-binding (CB) domain-containing protein n=1 Tax=Aphanomyces invadans TaxID=157072 RepID=A0A024UJB8_9STRA|nr:hypothetical protein H310_02657 [Aphanomyces invadans]ETW06384.1 hypothetical protein H310_02657 [Aphanomyces invadans]|eukprot:XP_008864459.1 hypothetical protein H310_02657 [Aphanomyces invadans]